MIKFSTPCKMKGLYIHIPFCRERCIYCDFPVIDVGGRADFLVFRKYVNLLNKEISLRLVPGVQINTLYLGGGTPSILGGELLFVIVEHLSKLLTTPLLEFTIEVNPEDIDLSFAKAITKLGVTRVSVGIQSMSDKNLKTLSRRHTRTVNESAIKMLQDCGITNINCDVIFDIPYSTIEEVSETVEWLVKMSIPHISAYGLTVEPLTPLSVFVRKGGVLPKENFQEEFLFIHEFLESNGFIHYEISNYAKPGFECVHNTIYWDRGEYIGVGVGAWGFVGNKRYQNDISVRKYSEKLSQGLLPVMFEEEIDRVKAFEETVMLGFRKKNGFSIKEVERFLSESEMEKFLSKLTLFEGEYLFISGGRVIPSLKGWLFSDYVVGEIISGVA